MLTPAFEGFPYVYLLEPDASQGTTLRSGTPHPYQHTIDDIPDFLDLQ